MAKSRRTCYFVDQKDLWDKGRPFNGYQYSNKKNKVMAHRIERAWVKESLYRELQSL